MLSWSVSGGLQGSPPYQCQIFRYLHTEAMPRRRTRTGCVSDSELALIKIVVIVDPNRRFTWTSNQWKCLGGTRPVSGSVSGRLPSVDGPVPFVKRLMEVFSSMRELTPIF